MNCPICNSDTFHHIKKYDDRYGYPGIFNFNKCSKCGHIALIDPIDKNKISELYESYYPRAEYDLNLHKPFPTKSLIKAWLDGEACNPSLYVKPNSRVLEIGCGNCETLAYYEKLGCEAHGVEVDGNIRKIVDKFGYKVHIGFFDKNIYQREYFDYVVLSQVIEHIYEPDTFFGEIESILKPGGEIVISTPNANGWGAKFFDMKWLNWHAPYHIHFFSYDSISLAIKNTKLNILSINTITHSNWLYYQILHNLFYPRKGTPSYFWKKNNAKIGLSKKIALKLLSIINLLKINHLITRFFDILRLGDNYLIVLKK